MSSSREGGHGRRSVHNCGRGVVGTRDESSVRGICSSPGGVGSESRANDDTPGTIAYAESSAGFGHGAVARRG